MASLHRVVVANPRPKKRAKLRRRKGVGEMAVKKRRRRLKRKSGPKAKRVVRRKRRRKAAGASVAPKRRRRLKRRRVARASSTRRRAAPRRRKRARTRTRRRNPFARMVASNPRRRRLKRGRRRSGFRRSRRNPGIPTWALVGLAGIAGLSVYALSGAGSFALTQRIDPSMATLERNRYIAGGVAAAAGLGVALLGKGPTSAIIGAGLFAGGIVGLAGTDLYLALGKVLDKAPAAAPAAPAKITGIYQDGEQQVQGLFQDGKQLLDGVFADGAQQFGAIGEQWKSPLGQSYGYGYGG